MRTENFEEPNWNEVLNNINWTEFEFEKNKFRTGKYSLDGGEVIGIHVFLGTKSPDPSGWAGMSWCNQNGVKIVWPGKEKINEILNNFQKQETKEIPKNIPISPSTAKRY